MRNGWAQLIVIMSAVGCLLMVYYGAKTVAAKEFEGEKTVLIREKEKALTNAEKAQERAKIAEAQVTISQRYDSINQRRTDSTIAVINRVTNDVAKRQKLSMTVTLPDSTKVKAQVYDSTVYKVEKQVIVPKFVKAVRWNDGFLYLTMLIDGDEVSVNYVDSVKLARREELRSNGVLKRPDIVIEQRPVLRDGRGRSGVVLDTASRKIVIEPYTNAIQSIFKKKR